ncbi:cell division cycle-associated protein 2 isoform X2 [Colius striatus]|uniref:cell division cycle-associated protein 2 isoform X2 n=1 Tax=Colius striatus TaxID=57412 RepID=UPI002B1D5406|nr:cell division cycle-associated protein 2 isoform X2 [Colius striatus]
MHRQSKNINAPREDKENESRYTEEKEEVSFPDVSKDRKICKVAKSKAIRASKKRNLSDGNHAQLQKCTLKYTEGLEKESHHAGDVVSCQFTECSFDMHKVDVVGESTLPLNSKGDFSSRPVSLGLECYLTPNRAKAEEQSVCGISEEQRKKPVDFATVTIAEFGITPDSFTKPSIGKSSTPLKYRRRSAIGARGSPENNTLIQYLAQQRSNRQKPAFTQISPFKHENARSLKDKIEAFQTSFKLVQEAEGETGFSGLSQVDDASQKAGSYVGSEHIPAGVRSNTVSDLSRKKVSFVEELILETLDENKPLVTPPLTPLQSGTASFSEHRQNSSRPRSVLRKTPMKQPMHTIKEYSNEAIGRGGGGDESPSVSSCADISEALQTENSEGYSSEMPKKKRVTFGEVLSPEIFDETLPANTPLRRGATPVRRPSLQSTSPCARSSLLEEPLSQPNFDCSDECIEPCQESVEGPVAAEDLLPVENAEAETDKSDVTTIRSSGRKKCSSISEGTDTGNSRAANTKNAKETKTPRKDKIQRQKNVTTSTVKKTQKKHTGYGKRRKKKVKKSLYGEREMASKKPLLSPIPEIPEGLSSASSPSSPMANALFSGNTKSKKAHKDVQQKPVVTRIRRKSSSVGQVCASSKDHDIVGADSSNDTGPQVSDGDVESVCGIDCKFSNLVPRAKHVSDTSDYFQQSEKTACVQEAKESGSLIEEEKLQGNLLNTAEQLNGLEFLEHQDISVHGGAQGARCPQEDYLTGCPPRRRSSAIYFPPVETLEITGNNLPVTSFNVEEVLSAPQVSRRKHSNGEKRVRRSMRLLKDAGSEGLAWIQVPRENPKSPLLLTSACKTRRTISTSILTESENIQHREQNLIQLPALGKENSDSVHLADGPCKRWRRKSTFVSIPQETRAWSQNWKRSTTNSVYRKERSNPKKYEEVEIPLENNSNI